VDQATDGRASWVIEALDLHEAGLVAYATRRTRDVHAARDVVQEAFLRLCSEDRDRVGPHVKAWLYTVCRRLAIDASRKERRMEAADDAVLDKVNGREADPAGAAETRDSAARAQSLLADLPENQRECIDLKFRHGLKYREIADVTGLSVGNVGFLIHTGLTTLRERIGREARRAAGGVQ
jgi:RNA polymerase sigma factor (sigma-70 family)